MSKIHSKGLQSETSVWKIFPIWCEFYLFVKLIHDHASYWQINQNHVINSDQSHMLIFYSEQSLHDIYQVYDWLRLFGVYFC